MERWKDSAVTGLRAQSLGGSDGEEREREKKLQIWLKLMQLQLPL